MRSIVITLLLCISASFGWSQDIKVFEAEFKKAVKKKKVEQVADFFELPLFSMDLGFMVPLPEGEQPTGEISRAQLVEHYKVFFSKETVKTIVNSPLVDGKDLYSENTWMIRFMKDEESTAWFVVSIVDGKYKITGTDNVSQ